MQFYFFGALAKTVTEIRTNTHHSLKTTTSLRLKVPTFIMPTKMPTWKHLPQTSPSPLVGRSANTDHYTDLHFVHSSHANIKSETRNQQTKCWKWARWTTAKATAATSQCPCPWSVVTTQFILTHRLHVGRDSGAGCAPQWLRAHLHILRAGPA